MDVVTAQVESDRAGYHNVKSPFTLNYYQPLCILGLNSQSIGFWERYHLFS